MGSDSPRNSSTRRSAGSTCSSSTRRRAAGRLPLDTSTCVAQQEALPDDGALDEPVPRSAPRSRSSQPRRHRRRRRRLVEYTAPSGTELIEGTRLHTSSTWATQIVTVTVSTPDRARPTRSPQRSATHWPSVLTPSASPHWRRSRVSGRHTHEPRTSGVTMGRYDGRVAVITGAARGIGYGSAQRFADEGASVAIVDLDESASKKAAAALPGADHPKTSHLGIGCDVSRRGRVDAAVARVVEAARRHPRPGQQRRHHPRQPALQDDRRRLGPGHGRAPAGRVPHDAGCPEALRRAEVRQDPQPLERVGARQPRPGQLLHRQDGHPGADSHPRDRARPVRRSTPTRSPPASSPPT